LFADILQPEVPMKPTVDLQNDPEIPAGREIMEHLVGAHMVASDEEELLHLVRHSLDPALTVSPEKGLRIAIHSSYHGQKLILELLGLATSQQIQLEECGLDLPIESEESERFKRARLELWLRLRDDELRSPRD
jgi:hypothetical protein